MPLGNTGKMILKTPAKVLMFFFYFVEPCSLHVSSITEQIGGSRCTYTMISGLCYSCYVAWKITLNKCTTVVETVWNILHARAVPVVIVMVMVILPGMCFILKIHQNATNYSYQGSHTSWKVLDLFLENSMTWKVLENHFGPGKSRKLKLKVLESPGKISLKVMHFSSGSNGKQAAIV